MNFIDLSLPSGTLWADRNVGADKPEEYGDHMTWDEAMKLDVQLPDIDRIRELIECCEWTWSDGGYTVTGTNSNSIFLPAAGYRNGSDLNGAGFSGSYWSRSLHDGYAGRACGLGFYSDRVYWARNGRGYGQSVRPVITRDINAERSTSQGLSND